MKMAKSYKLTVLILAFIASIVFALGFMGYSNAKAAIEPSSYIAYEGRTAEADDLKFENDNIVAKLYNGAKLQIKNKLTVNDLSLKFSVPAEATSFSVVFTATAYDVNGNKKVDGDSISFDKEIEYVVNIDLATAGDVVEIKTAIDNGFLKATVNGVDAELPSSDYYKLECVDKTVASVEIVAEFPEANDGKEISIISVNQVASKGDDFETNPFIQTFAIENNGIKNIAMPVIEIGEKFFTFEEGIHNVALGRKFTIALSGTSFLGTFSSSSYSVASSDSTVVIDDSVVAFTEVGYRTIEIKDNRDDSIVASYEVNVVDEIEDTVAPKYIVTENAIASFNNELQALVSEVSVGKNENLTLGVDMFRTLVSDNVTNFEELSYKLYYMTESKQTSVSSLKIPLSEAGHYEFYVVFTDKAGNQIDIDNFYYYDKDGNVCDGEYAKCIFEFDVLDDSSLSISASKPGTGYVGTKYNASSFTVDASFTYTDTYKLYYASSYDSENPDATTWVEITESSKATDNDKDYNGYTYDEIKNIAYDGKLAFTPDKVGFYKIEVKITSSSSTKSATESMIIEVKPVVKTVKVDTKWLQNNIWPVVFLSVGTICLVVIIVLLFTKPKEEDNDIDFDQIVRK